MEACQLPSPAADWRESCVKLIPRAIQPQFLLSISPGLTNLWLHRHKAGGGPLPYTPLALVIHIPYGVGPDGADALGDLGAHRGVVDAGHLLLDDGDAGRFRLG